MKVVIEFDTNDEASTYDATRVLAELSGLGANSERLKLARLIHLDLKDKAEYAVKVFMKEHEGMIDSIMDLEYYTLRGDISNERKIINEIRTAIHRANKGS